MSQKIYVVTMENNDMDEMEIGYASTSRIADRMIETVSSTDGFEHNNYRSFQATLDHMEINDEDVNFEEPEIIENVSISDNRDLLVQFAMLWGITTGSALNPEEIKYAEEMKQWNSVELYNMFTAWSTEYLAQDEVEDTVEFFEKKLKKLLNK